MSTYQKISYMNGQIYYIDKSKRNWNRALDKAVARREYWNFHKEGLLNWRAWIAAILIAAFFVLLMGIGGELPH